MLCLRQPRSVDVDAIAAIAGDPRTSEHIPAGALTVVASRGLVRDWIEDWASDAVGYWVVEEPNSGAVIGWEASAFVAAADVRLLNLAYRVARSHWGRGVATWVARRALATASARFAAAPVIARIAPGNVASVRTAEKAGLRVVGRDGQHWPVYADRELPPALLLALPRA